MPSPNLFPISSDTKKDGEKQGLRLCFFTVLFILSVYFYLYFILPVFIGLLCPFLLLCSAQLL